MEPTITPTFSKVKESILSKLDKNSEYYKDAVAAKDTIELFNAISNYASEIGESKGYGQEGIAGIIEDICGECYEFITE